MFDTMTFVKAFGSLCGAFLIYLLGGWVAQLIYQPEGGHGDEHAMAYVIHAEEDGAEAVVEEGPSFEEIYAAADVSEGSNLFRRNCASCHSDAAGENGTGPTLFGVVGRDVGTTEGFGYSGSLVAVVSNWTPEELNNFIEGPRSYAPGTAMSYNGMSKPEDRANLIAWLDALDE